LPDKVPSALVRASIAALLLLLGYALSIATRTGLADVYAAPAKSYLQTERNAGEMLTGDEWQALYGSLVRALSLAPGDPENLSELGRLYRTLLEASDLDAGEISDHGDAAAGYYQAALALRPTWPWDWGNLALVKYQQYQDTSGASVAFAVPRMAALQQCAPQAVLSALPCAPPGLCVAKMQSRYGQLAPDGDEQVDGFEPDPG
jgi:hypothetical protein